jgi:serine/threonine protein phosphatase PrpC
MLRSVVANPFRHAVAIAALRGAGQDRAAVLEIADGLVIALADGAGGTANGALAAQAVIDAAASASAAAGAPATPGTTTTSPSWSALLSELDRDPARLGHGQTTAIVLAVTRGAVRGASVGDSTAWLLHGSDIDDLTDGQTRKPLLGAGSHPFTIAAAPIGDGTLLVASDGLVRYARPADIARIASGPDLAAAAHALVELVRLPSGGLQDDISVVLVREA